MRPAAALFIFFNLEYESELEAAITARTVVPIERQRFPIAAVRAGECVYANRRCRRLQSLPRR